MPICPRGHDSQAEDWCDVCGFPMASAASATGGPSFGPPSYDRLPPPPYAEAEPTAGLATCPICRTPQTGRYCEECGYDYDLSAPSRRQHQSPPYAPPPPVQQPPGPPPAQHQPMPLPQPPSYGYPQPGAPLPGAPEHYGAPGPALGDPFAAYAPPAQPQQSPPGGDAQGPRPPSAPPSAPSYGTGFDTDFRLSPPITPLRGPDGAEAPPVRTNWVAVVRADREYFTQMMSRSGPEAQGLYFPPYCPERRIPLTGRGQVRIGRRSHHRGTVPEIDLSVPPEDPGASHQHALLQEQPDGNWIVVDQDSTNGTTVNGAADPIDPHTPIPLRDGDRIHIGAWTTITIHHA
jgi:hypothetical protein